MIPAADNLLTLIAFLPLAGMCGILMLPSHRHNLIRAFAVAVTGIELILTCFLLGYFAPDRIDDQTFREDKPRPAGGELSKVLQMPVIGHPVPVGHVNLHRRHRDPVAHGQSVSDALVEGR